MQIIVLQGCVFQARGFMESNIRVYICVPLCLEPPLPLPNSIPPLGYHECWAGAPCAIQHLSLAVCLHVINVCISALPLILSASPAHLTPPLCIWICSLSLLIQVIFQSNCIWTSLQFSEKSFPMLKTVLRSGCMSPFSLFVWWNSVVE